MENILNKIIAQPLLHAQWLNTLSMMENVGAKKIKNCEHPVFVNEIILKHSAEEARHAYYLKKQIHKVSKNTCETYEKKHLLAPKTSYYYLHALDVRVSRFLKSDYHFTDDTLKYAAYLLVTYAIEVRADDLYPRYQTILTENKSLVSVKTIIAEEKNHLEEMTAQLKVFSVHWQNMIDNVCAMEEELFQSWMRELEELLQ